MVLVQEREKDGVRERERIKRHQGSEDGRGRVRMDEHHEQGARGQNCSSFSEEQKVAGGSGCPLSSTTGAAGAEGAGGIVPACRWICTNWDIFPE